jgi:putative ABC transport system permease protein
VTRGWDSACSTGQDIHDRRGSDARTRYRREHRNLSVIYATFFEPLPYRDADRLVMVWSQQRGERIPASPADFVEWKRQATAFEDVNAWSWSTAAVAMTETVEQLQVGPATPGFLGMFGYGHPLTLGRDFLESEGTSGNDQVVILTYRYGANVSPIQT